MRTKALFLLVWCWVGMTSLAAGDPVSEPAIEIPRIAVQDEQLRSYGVGDVLKVNLVHADLRRAGGAGALRLRIFRGSKAELLGPLRYSAPDGCLIYRSGLYQATEYNGGILVRTQSGRDLVFSSGWLASEGEGRVADQHFVLVVEKGSEAREILKIRPDDARRYFAHGFEFIVKAPRQPMPPLVVAALLRQQNTAREESARQVSEALRETPARPRCLVFSPLTFASVGRLAGRPCNSPGAVAPARSATAEPEVVSTALVP